MRSPALLFVLLFALALSSAALAQGTDRADTRQLREAVQRGELASLDSILEDALRRKPGRVVDVEFELEDDEYEIEILDANGRVWELEYRASTGEFKDMEQD
ncbi:MAG: peptidase [Xanthomonadales bacterium]|nr:peptidase [Xanthomonadales bacterium]